MFPLLRESDRSILDSIPYGHSECVKHTKILCNYMCKNTLYFTGIYIGILCESHASKRDFFYGISTASRCNSHCFDMWDTHFLVGNYTVPQCRFHTSIHLRPPPPVPEYIRLSPLSLRAIEAIAEGACKVIAVWSEASIAGRVAEAVAFRGRLILLRKGDR